MAAILEHENLFFQGFIEFALVRFAGYFFLDNFCNSIDRIFQSDWDQFVPCEETVDLHFGDVIALDKVGREESETIIAGVKLCLNLFVEVFADDQVGHAPEVDPLLLGETIECLFEVIGVKSIFAGVADKNLDHLFSPASAGDEVVFEIVNVAAYSVRDASRDMGAKDELGFLGAGGFLLVDDDALVDFSARGIFFGSLLDRAAQSTDEVAVAAVGVFAPGGNDCEGFVPVDRGILIQPDQELVEPGDVFVAECFGLDQETEGFLDRCEQGHFLSFFGKRYRSIAEK